MPKVSVIIPNYNHERYLIQRIESVLGQSFRDIEVIILDDCSTDHSKGIIEQYRSNPRVKHIVYNTTNSGSTFRQWEKGMQLAIGEWIWIAESDDYCEPAMLDKLLQAQSGHDKVGIAFCMSHWVDAHGVAGDELPIYKTSLFMEGPEAVKEMAVHCTVQNASSCIIKRDEALEAVRGLGKYKACGDWVFYTRILQHTNLVHVGERLNYFRWYHANISSKAKERLWMTEGVDVLTNINYGIVKFTKKEFTDLMRYWKWKTGALAFKDKMAAWLTVIEAAARYKLKV